MKPFIIFILIPLVLQVSSLWARDPFWPIGYQSGGGLTAQQVEKIDQEPNQTRQLSDEELRELARKEAERIRQTLDRKGTAIMGDRIYAHVQGKWVTQGETIDVEVMGNTYRLKITKLTSDNIELEAHRAAGPLQTKPRK